MRLARIHLALVVGAACVAGGFATLSTAQSSRSSATDRTRLPLGDGRVTASGPRRGWVFACRVGGPGGSGAFRDGPWIKSNGTFDLTAKAVVNGNVAWPGQVVFRRTNGRLLILGNGLPNSHGTGIFPISPSDDAYAYDRNPNRIRGQFVGYNLPASPARAGRRSCLPGGPIGVARNGVVIYIGLDAASRDAVAHETHDRCGGHPQRSGQYHYHAIPGCLTAGASRRRHSRLVGYALDGFRIYGHRGAGGKLLTNADLDACHGHSHRIGGRRRYHYHATLEYPYTLGCFRGTPAR